MALSTSTTRQNAKGQVEAHTVTQKSMQKSVLSVGICTPMAHGPPHSKRTRHNGCIARREAAHGTMEMQVGGPLYSHYTKAPTTKQERQMRCQRQGSSAVTHLRENTPRSRRGSRRRMGVSACTGNFRGWPLVTRAAFSLAPKKESVAVVCK